MRGEDQRSEGFFSYVRLEARIPPDHPLRAIRDLADAALRELSPAFNRLMPAMGAHRSRRSGCCSLPRKSSCVLNLPL
jgi:hypothetical protein